MRIVVLFKVVPDDQDILALPNGELDFSKAHNVVSAYDLNAIEAAVQIASQQEGGTVIALTVGGAGIDDSKLKKNVLARGVDELKMIADDACSSLDAFATSSVLAKALKEMDNYDLIVSGDGSADNYTQQVDGQLSQKLNLPFVNAVTKAAVKEGVLCVERVLEDEIEQVEVPLPAVVSVSPDIAQPRIPGMKDILAAGKKPMEVNAASEVPANATKTLKCEASVQSERGRQIFDVSVEGALEQFAKAIREAV